ncbi:MAG: tetratricopeptide repeat protein [Chloroflexi bacterium]|nr:tetratricopeptide repeat protein [Chloroflexota bacterium]
MNKLAQRLGLTRYRADERYRAGLAAFVSRDLESAIRELQMAAELLPSHAEYHAALGFVLLDGKRQREARESFKQALTLNRYEMLANYGRGIIAYRGKSWLEALNFFSAAYAAQPERAETEYYLGMINHRLGRNKEAVKWMEAAAAAFAKTGDRRESHCTAWLREFHKLLPGA